MKKEELQHIRTTIKYLISDKVEENDFKYSGLILKSNGKKQSNKSDCYLIDEENKVLNYLPSKPEGFINRGDCTFICFSEETDTHKVIHTITHYCILWFDKPISLREITNALKLY